MVRTPNAVIARNVAKGRKNTAKKLHDVDTDIFDTFAGGDKVRPPCGDGDEGSTNVGCGATLLALHTSPTS